MKIKVHHLYPMVKKMIFPHFKWFIRKCPSVCTFISKASTGSLILSVLKFFINQLKSVDLHMSDHFVCYT